MSPGQALTGRARQISELHLVDFERVIWERVANVHSDPEVAKKVGMERPIASGQNQLAFLHEMLQSRFGDGWVRGGRISVRWLKPLYLGDVVTPMGSVSTVEVQGSRTRVAMEVWCENQDGDRTAIGTAEAWE
jgi:acyl dehydratase